MIIYSITAALYVHISLKAYSFILGSASPVGGQLFQWLLENSCDQRLWFVWKDGIQSERCWRGGGDTVWTVCRVSRVTQVGGGNVCILNEQL